MNGTLHRVGLKRRGPEVIETTGQLRRGNCEAETIHRAVEVAGSCDVKQPMLRLTTVPGDTPESATDR